MAWNAPTTETITTPTRVRLVVLGGYGDQSSNQRLMDFSGRDTKDIYSIELIELRYKPTAAEVGDINVVRLAWDNDSRVNDDNRHYRILAPSRLSDGSYISEFNIPRNIYKFDGTSHRPYNQSFVLDLYKEATGTKMATEYILCTLRVTTRHTDGVELNRRFEPTILNALT
jgi:hypothetical protein